MVRKVIIFAMNFEGIDPITQTDGYCYWFYERNHWAEESPWKKCFILTHQQAILLFNGY